MKNPRLLLCFLVSGHCIDFENCQLDYFLQVFRRFYLYFLSSFEVIRVDFRSYNREAELVQPSEMIIGEDMVAA